MIDLSYIAIILSLFLVILLITNQCEYFSSQSYDNINPGFGSQMSQLETANPINYDTLSNNWNEGSFGKLVSYMENTSMFPSIKNLNV
jgi:hypothetical protein